MEGLLANPLIQSVALPLGLGFMLTGLVGFGGGRRYGPRLAGLAIGVGFFAAYLAILGLPPLPPRSSSQKIAYLAAGGVALGVLLDLVDKRWIDRAAVVVWPSVGIVWLAAPRLRAAGPSFDLWPVVLLGTVTVAALLRLDHRRDAGLTPSIMLMTAALGLAGVALIGSSASISQAAGAMAAAVAGLLLWNWPTARFAFGAAALFGAGATLAFLAVQTALYSRASGWALAALAPLFLADLALPRVRMGSGAVGRALAPVALGGLCLVFAIAAWGIAHVASLNSPAY